MYLKKSHIALAIGIAFLLLACGETKQEPVTVTTKTTSLKGDLKDYFEVVDKDYTIKIDDPESLYPEGIITVEIKRTGQDFDFPTDNINPFGTNGSEDYHVGFGIEIYDESSPVIIKNATSGGMSGPYSDDDVKGLMALNEGETGFIRWTVDQDKLDGLKDFIITSALKKENNVSMETSTPQQKTISQNTAHTTKEKSAVDDALDSYEKYVDRYIKVMKKAKDGGISAMQEYSSLLEKAENLQDKLEAMENDFSAKQMGRMMQIQQKMANAALEMQ